MSERMKARTTDGFVEFSLRVPESQAERVGAALRAIVALLPEASETAPVADEDLDDDTLYSPDEVFGSWTPGAAVRAYRLREGLTQAALARGIEVTRSVVSDLETGRRPVSGAMARRLGEFFKAEYKNFL
ncbi:transcriptional regulator, XRE family [Solidesulfovibrio fructosivorans JJ]]|uniref:Transcriptional regulator, XRE family n=1 Tax=Solidesulfovibrio fructosivorans JJ] TaxID=596151 RepID=E1JXK4_SOLFR|nr:helix-turn-helix transcriptional regulator [Solidesulfovibrio fructosivorans]EFL50981.1 transcriptional regulator, XRE family [Solidesulfovibrio fructosivorans JJ]]